MKKWSTYFIHKKSFLRNILNWKCYKIHELLKNPTHEPIGIPLDGLNKKLQFQRNGSIPVINSFFPPSDDIRNHWIEHFNISGAPSSQGMILKCEPKVSEPSNSYKWGSLSSSLLHFSSWKKKQKKTNHDKWTTKCLVPNLNCICQRKKLSLTGKRKTKLNHLAFFFFYR